MKTKLLAAMIVVFMLHSVAVAQEDYYIRTDSRINLRATYSLEGEKVETVPEGTILHVVGRFNRWLKIDRNGEVLWLADWVYYTRVDDGSQESSTSQDQFDLESFQIVDNCCQVDRQCNAEQEWTAGYLAYQNGHCRLPYVESRVDGVLIEGTQAFVIQIQRALDLLKTRSPEWYAYATSGLDKIEEAPDFTGGYVRASARTFWETQGNAFHAGISETSLIWLAGAFVHEACHVHRYEAGLVSGGHEGERNCLELQIAVLEAIDPHDRFMGYLRDDLLANFDNVEKQWWWR